MIEEGIVKGTSTTIGGMEAHTKEDYGMADEWWTDVEALNSKGKGKSKGQAEDPKGKGKGGEKGKG